MALTWQQKRAADIKQLANARYGAGWNKLSQDQQQNFIRSEVLMLLLTQDGEKYKPAQEMAESILSELLTNV